MYNSIYNDPHERTCRLYSDVYWDDMFSAEEVKKLEEYCDTLETDIASTQGDARPDLKKIRTSKVAWLTRNDETAWIFDRFNHLFYLVNERFYNFNLNGYDTIQYTTYNENDKGEYTWHMDASLADPIVENGAHRKLSMTFQLNDDFEGGDFMINTGKEEDARRVDTKKGRAILFPSFVLHRVTPVTKGTRKSLVIWCLGPKFT